MEATSTASNESWLCQFDIGRHQSENLQVHGMELFVELENCPNGNIQSDLIENMNSTASCRVRSVVEPFPEKVQRLGFEDVNREILLEKSNDPTSLRCIIQLPNQAYLVELEWSRSTSVEAQR